MKSIQALSVLATMMLTMMPAVVSPVPVLSQEIPTAVHCSNCSNNQSILQVTPYNPGVEGHLVISTIIHGPTEMMLVDSQLRTSEGAELAKKLKAMNKKLIAIYISHEHVDHHWGVWEVLKVFPNTPVYSSPESVKGIEQGNAAGGSASYRPYPYYRDSPKMSYIPTPFTNDTLAIDGENVEFLRIGRGDTYPVVSVYVPSVNTLVAADLVVAGMHVLVADSPEKEQRQEWLQTLQKVREMTLNGTTVIAGHIGNENHSSIATVEVIDSNIQYLNTFEEALLEPNRSAAWNYVMSRFDTLEMPFLLDWSLDVFYEDSGRIPETNNQSLIISSTM
ncbi:hypothetical protein K7432_006545 [Basidiobolus ranarum]|uniref:Metallo-beta-lactamase domain-containing protein n=1 Tax=Basidiobolus ranarum TaxID=34480 RepID=A0ABR2W1F8_9FUNG